jgi:hypothetical protein
MATFVFHALNDDGRLDGTISGDHAAPHRSRLDPGSCKQVVNAERLSRIVRTKGIIPRQATNEVQATRGDIVEP